MANEKRLIDANELRQTIESKIYWGGVGLLEAIDDAPTVDAVEVVRCKDCEHCGVLEHNGKRYCKNPMGCFGCVPTESYNYCSYGKRRDGE